MNVQMKSLTATEDHIPTPCQTGRLCQVPKIRGQILADEEIDEDQRATALESLDELCDHETHPDDWFELPEVGYGTPAYWRSQRARARCFNDCPIRIACLLAGMEPDNLDHGIWGGYTAAQRAQVQTAWAQRKEHNDAEEKP